MVRKPYPKEAAARVREFLAQEGIELSSRKVLEIVALVEGYNSWQTMYAAVRAEVNQRQAQTRREFTAYENAWQALQPLIAHKVGKLCFLLRGDVRTQYWVSNPSEELDDEARMSFYVERKPLPGEPVLAVNLRLIENELKPGEFALRLNVDDKDGQELMSWTSGPNYTPQLYTNDIDELKDRLQSDFEPSDLLLALYDTSATQYLKAR